MSRIGPFDPDSRIAQAEVPGRPPLFAYVAEQHAEGSNLLVEFDGVDTLFLSRLMCVDPDAAAPDWSGTEVEPRFLRNSRLKPSDVYFVPGAISRRGGGVS